MYQISKPFFMLCETPLHVGSGTDIGIIDMPIQRESTTNYPKIEASGLKGCIREAFEDKAKSKDEKIKNHIVFGYDSSEKNKEITDKFKNNQQFAAALGFTDARLLLFPVKSMKGVFAWITCPDVLERLRKDLGTISGMSQELLKIGLSDTHTAILPQKSQLLINGNKKDKNIILEEYSFSVEESEECTKIAQWLAERILPQGEEHKAMKEKLETSLVILPDNDFNDFITLSTEVVTRTKIDNETGTVTNTGLFNEEYLPTDTVMYSFALFSSLYGIVENGFSKSPDPEKNAKQVEEYFSGNFPSLLQIGANATIGKGIVSTKLMGGE
ncbi:CRISPR-associated protein, Cmr4 family [Tindallia magadiensis]|uniref:CRISPR-associated protein, Cmr4 family n=1 Tax=Tindallia magadiensis TaxID=69895 RepID=A0A1I3END3_9FIRM|nr:type III-B CRISPR module RAMP protein Cmr4 [Tindallia magadiensis]SFI00497.1 CRISPR-associated protein, Cmr4 family [Tindallia magadiensis]